MTIRLSARSRLAWGLAFAWFLLPGIFCVPACAEEHHDDRGDHRGGDRRGGGDHGDGGSGGNYGAPPVVYAPPGYYPPPVVYGPAVGIVLPGISIGIR